MEINKIKITTITTSDTKKTILEQKKSRKKKFLYGIFIVLVIFITATAGLLIRIQTVSKKIFVGQKTTFYGNLSHVVAGLFNNHAVTTVAPDQEQTEPVTILLLGVGGDGHDGAYLSDTMIVAQIRPDLHKVTLISIPRDLLVTIDNYGQQKINAAFALALKPNEDFNEAGKAATLQVEKLSGLSIPYFAVLDFRGFKDAINIVGGVDVTVDSSFTDYSYPADVGNGYLPPVVFTQGFEHMNGTKALQFARSRHAAGPEGNDFARSQRQQKIIDAAKAKLVSLNILTDASKLNNLLTVIADHFHTNINPQELYTLYTTLKSYPATDILSSGLTPETNLICPQALALNNSDLTSYVLKPCANVTSTDIQHFFSNSFNVPPYIGEHAIISIASNQKNKKQAEMLTSELSKDGFIVQHLPYTGSPFVQSELYDMTGKPLSSDFIKTLTQATQITTPPTGVVLQNKTADIIIIPGTGL